MSLSNLEEYRSHRDKFESMYTFIVHSVTGQEFLDYLHKMLDRIKSIKDATKKKYLNDRLYELVTFVDNKNKPDGKLNSVILLGPELIEIKLSDKHKNTLTEYNIHHITYHNQPKFDIDYVADLFFNFSFREVIRIKNTDVEHIQMNANKRKIVMSCKLSKIDLTDYIKKSTSGKCVIHGISSSLKTLKIPNCNIFTKLMDDNEIFEVFELEETLSIHKSLQESLDCIQNEKKSHLIKFGKDIIDNAHNVKTIFCSHDKIKRVKNYFSQHSLNPEIFLVLSIKKGDVGDLLHDQYGGTIAVMYY